MVGGREGEAVQRDDPSWVEDGDRWLHVVVGVRVEEQAGWLHVVVGGEG